MREIKFRAWDGDRDEMLYPGEFELWQEEDNGFHGGRVHEDFGWTPFTLLQSAGLKDNTAWDDLSEDEKALHPASTWDGREIWEGDRVKDLKFNRALGNVVFKQGAFWVHWNTLGVIDELVAVCCDRIQVVGDIYTTPDAVETGKGGGEWGLRELS